MGAVGHVVALFATGAVVLFGAFMALAEISPTEVAAPAAVAAALAVVLLVRSLWLERELRDPGGSPDLREAANRQRERRGF